MMVMPRAQWNPRASAPQLDDVFRIMSGAASGLSNPPVGSGLGHGWTARPDSFPPLPRRFESFQTADQPPVLTQWRAAGALKSTER
jgi:hypothetical protein